MRTNRRSYTEVPLRHDQLVRQFVLAEDRMHLPPSWPEVRIGHEAGWVLACHPALPVLAVEGNGGRQIGYLLGWPLDEHQGFVSAQPEAKLCLDVDASQMLERGAGEESPLEKALYRLGGRWVFILAPHSSFASGRIYLDPLGSQPVVYSAPLRMVAATTALIPHTEATGYDAELVALMDLPRQDRWFPFGLTPRRSCSRLLPNHYLDLATMCPVRHWPLGNDKVDKEDIQESVKSIALTLERNVSSIAEASLVLSGLTAGNETRMLLAASRSHRKSIAFFTLDGFTKTAKLDVRVAKRLARNFRLNHRVVLRQQAAEADMQTWFERVGECVAGAAMRNVTMKDKVFPDRIQIQGMGGEIARCYYRNEGATPGGETPSTLSQRLRLPVNAQVVKAASDWIDSLPGQSYRILDLLYLENRVGAWAAPQVYGSTQAGVILWPLCDRSIIAAMLALPLEYKCNNHLARDVVQYLWPELLKVPINEEFGLMRARARLKPFFARLHPRRLF